MESKNIEDFMLETFFLLAANYSMFLAEVMNYGGEGQKPLIKRGWMEQPPQPIDRNEFYKSKLPKMMGK